MSGAKKWDCFIRFGATASPLDSLEPDLVWVDADTGGTKVCGHPKAVGSCASAAMVGLPYRDIIRHVSDAQGRHPYDSTAPTWLWLLAYVDVYDM